MLMFNRFTLKQRENALVKQGWSILFRRFRLRKLDDFTRYGLPVPKEDVSKDGYFTVLLKQPYTLWHLLLDPPLLARKIFYRLYPHVPGLIRRTLKRTHRRIDKGKDSSS